MRPRVIQLAPFPVAPDYIAPNFPFELQIAPAEGGLDWLRANGAGVHVVLSHAMRGITAAEIEALPDLKLIAYFGVGLDAVDLNAARARGLMLTHTPDVLTDDVADLALALTLAAMRRIAEGDRFVRAGAWTKGRFPLAAAPRGKTFGIFGLGRIGLAAAKRAEAFGFEIGYCNRAPKPGLDYPYFPDISKLAEWADVLVIAAPGGAETRHVVSREVMAALGPRGLLVNVARGSLVDEAALLAALQTGVLGAAALDVFEDEPNVDPAFFALENVVLAPHVGSGTTDTRAGMANHAYGNAIAFFTGAPLTDRYL